MRQSSKAILGITAGVIAYEAICDDGEMISQRCDEWLEKPIARELTYLVVGTIALHLVNMMPEQVDWLHQLGRLKKGDSM